MRRCGYVGVYFFWRRLLRKERPDMTARAKQAIDTINMAMTMIRAEVLITRHLGTIAPILSVARWRNANRPRTRDLD